MNSYLLLVLVFWTITAIDGLNCSNENYLRPGHCEINQQNILVTDRFNLPGNQELIDLFIFDSVMPVMPEKVFVYNPKLIFVSIYGSRTTEITKNKFANAIQLQKLFIQNNNISKLTNNTFINCKSLKNLELNSNKLITVDAAVFHGLGSLILLSISDNLIDYFPSTILNELVNLKTLIVNGNKLKYIDDNFFKNNINLIYVDLSQNQLKTVPVNLFSKLQFMNSIYLQNNSLTNVENIDVEFLEISNNKLTTFFIGSKVQNLHLQNNFIESLQCSKVLNVVFFGAGNNSLNNFNCIADMNFLTYLDVSSNKFKKPVSNQFVNLTHLRTFHLNNAKNAIQWKASFFKGLNNLFILHIDKLITYRFVKNNLPTLYMLGLKTKKWKCDFLQRVTSTLNRQNITLLKSSSAETHVCQSVI